MRWWQIKKRNADLERELFSDLELEEEEQRERGVPEEEARYAAKRAFGNPTLIREQTHEVWGWAAFERLHADLRYALRQLRKSPGFTLIAVLTLTLGMGATTAIFSLIHGALRLPFPEADRLITVKNKYMRASYISVSYPDFEEWQRENKTFLKMAAISPGRKTYLGQREPARLNVSWISSDFFSLFGLKPIVGRDFLDTERQRGAAPVCVLSESFWKEDFGGSPTALGRSIVLDGRSYSVVGVVPDMTPSFFLKAQVWVPLEADPPWDQHGTNYLIVTGLLKPNITIREAESDLAVIQSQINKQFPGNKHGIELQTLAETLFGNVRPVMVILLAAVSFILLIACVNLANMMLARATDRTREFGIRQALGASSKRLLMQSLTESGVIALTGGLLGLAVAFAATRIPVRAWPRFLEAPGELHVSITVLVFAGALAILTAVLCGIVPALQAMRQNASAGVREDDRTMSESRSRRALRSGLVAAEIAFATLLVGGALHMTLYFARLLHTDPGVRADHSLSMGISLSPLRYPQDSDQQRFFATLRQKLNTLPGVESSGGVSTAPFSGSAQNPNYVYEGGPAPDPSRMEFADTYFVTPGYLETMKVTLLRGRLFMERDTSDSPKAVVIDQSMAEKLWPNQNPIGKHIKIRTPDWQEVVGVIADVRGGGVAKAAGVQVYLPVEQYPGSASDLTMVLRTRGEPLEFAEAAKRAVHEIDPGQVVSNVMPVEALAAQSVAGQHTATVLIGALGVLALLLASVGVYGVMAYAVSRREREFGIRLALGAQRHQIFAMLLGSTARTVGLGIVAGTVLAVPLNVWMRSIVGQTQQLDPIAFAGTAVLLPAVAFFATLIPARRAACVEPMQAIRTE